MLSILEKFGWKDLRTHELKRFWLEKKEIFCDYYQKVIFLTKINLGHGGFDR
jgi:hypothetical protein